MLSENGNMQKDKSVWPQVLMVIGSLVVAFLIGMYGPGSPTERLAMTTGYALLVLVFLFGMVILVEIIRGNIDLKTLLSEDGKASMSRFQLLVFTFVIAMSLFLMVVEQKGTKFPEIPANVLTLLGISASTYAVSKGIQAGSKPDPNAPPPPPPPQVRGPGI
jgi:hypothetical protein